MVSIVKSEEDLSYWGLVKRFQKHPEDLKRCELYRPRATSTYQRWISGIDPKVLQEIITWMAGDDAAHSDIMSDSSGFRKAKIVEWRHAK